MPLTVTAPGKVIIAGEYAVLDGAPAICMAVNRRAEVTLAARASSNYRVTAPGLFDKVLELDTLADSSDTLPLLAACVQELSLASTSPLDIQLDSRAFVAADGAKLGIGASAAVTVALTAAMLHWQGSAASLSETAMAVHRRLQGGVGSGADIACSTAGGVLEYRRPAVTPTSIAWPDGLYHALFWSGQAADTTAKLARLSAVPEQASRAQLGTAAAAFAHCWRTANARQIVAELHRFTAVLRRFDSEYQLGVFGAGHAALLQASTAAELCYKPCGAGGGDVGIALAADPEALRDFAQAAADHGFQQLDLEIDAAGVVVTGSMP